jgi:multidrug efflux pump subunit AcrA (membrane-fusion protein)
VSQGVVESSNSSGSSQSGGSNQGGGSRSKLIQRLLSASSNLPGFVNDLLTTQAADGEPPFSLRPIAHIRPDNASAEVRAAAISAFQDLIRPCIEQQKDGAIEVAPPDRPQGEAQYCLITLLRNEGEVVAVSAVIARCLDLERAQQRLVSMQLVAGYFDLYTLRRTAEQSRVIAQSHQHVLQLVTAVSTAEGFQAAANNFCNELALRTGAMRVSLGWLKGNYVKVKALSHTENFDKRQELIVQLERAMEECLDQDEMVQFDPEGKQCTQNVTRSAESLSKAQGNNIVLSLPLRRQAEQVGVVTLEFPLDQRLSPQAASGLAVAVELLAPQLYDRYQNDRWLITKAGISTRELYKKAIGPKYWLAKTLIAVGLSLVAFVFLYRPMYHVTAPFQFVAEQRRLIAVPFDGAEIDEVFVRPGGESGRVKAGQVLLTFRTDDLELERAKAEARADALRREAEAYYADPSKIAEYRSTLAREREARVQAEHYAQQIKKATIVAPFDGEILKGDWIDKKGSVVKQGEVLFEIAKRGELRVELNVAERDVQFLRDDGTQRGFLATSSLPTERFPFVIDRIVPEPNAVSGDNVFHVYGRLDRSSPDWPSDLKSDAGWLPGMQGEAKIEDQPRSLAWQWTHRLTEWVRLKTWTWF